ncbi:hypothetical protein, partial [Sinorhizobium meliloti]|uniref:hypothetical protein n=1 Tax=Rhizobium meliloti TaxID=382 RepID=UPI001AECA0C9
MCVVGAFGTGADNAPELHEQTAVPGDTLCDPSVTGGTFYFQVRHANKNKGFALEIFGCRFAIRNSSFP